MASTPALPYIVSSPPRLAMLSLASVPLIVSPFGVPVISLKGLEAVDRKDNALTTPSVVGG